VGAVPTTVPLTGAFRRTLHIREGVLRCVEGPNQGETWRFDHALLRIGRGALADLRLEDEALEPLHCELRRTKQGVLLRDLDTSAGTWVGDTPVREVYLAEDTRFRVGGSVLAFRTIDARWDVVASDQRAFGRLVGGSIAMREAYGVLERVAGLSMPVLIRGETGTGKELAARAVHERSGRSGDLEIFDCGAAKAELIESALFGHERGAFTGAVDARSGAFERAHRGTLMLDEIGELPLELQPKLLRVLENREVKRLGGRSRQVVDVRIVAATNRDLAREVEEGRFRRDLYYRLCVVDLVLPPLRQRLEDLQLLSESILERVQGDAVRVTGLSPEVLEIFHAWRWPGNVRELHNVLSRAVPFCDEELVTLDALPQALREAPAVPPEELEEEGPPISSVPFKEAKQALIRAFERQYLRGLMAEHGGNLSSAARAAGVDRTTILRLLRRHRLR